MVTISIVNPAEWIPKVRPLLEANWSETGFDFPFSPDVALYQRMFDAGICFAVCAQIGDEVVGYCSVVVAPHPHNSSVVVGSNDALFVAPAYRRGTVTARLMHAAKAVARSAGAERFTWHARAGTQFHETLIQHGCVPVDNVVMERL